MKSPWSTGDILISILILLVFAHAFWEHVERAFDKEYIKLLRDILEWKRSDSDSPSDNLARNGLRQRLLALIRMSKNLADKELDEMEQRLPEIDRRGFIHRTLSRIPKLKALIEE